MDGWIGYKMVGSRAEQTRISLRNVGSTSRTGGPGCGWGRDTWSQPLLANQKVCASVARSCLRGTVCVCSRLLACPAGQKFLARIRVWHFHRSTTAASPAHSSLAARPSQGAMWGGPAGPWPANVHAFLGAQPELAWRNGNLQHRTKGFDSIFFLGSIKFITEATPRFCCILPSKDQNTVVSIAS
jgi:hypothetical protein